MKITNESVITYHASLGFVGADSVEEIEFDAETLNLDELQSSLFEWANEQISYEVEIDRENGVAIFTVSNGYVGADVTQEEELSHHFDEEDIENMSDDELINALESEVSQWADEQLSCWIEVDGETLDI